jgi:hypothetical protein
MTYHDETLPDQPAAINQAKADRYGALHLRQACLAKIASRRPSPLPGEWRRGCAALIHFGCRHSCASFFLSTGILKSVQGDNHAPQLRTRGRLHKTAAR